MHKDIRNIDSFVALFDILGYREWIRHNNVETVYNTLIKMKKMVEVNINRYINYAINGTFEKSVIEVDFYADSFFVYTNGTNDICFKALMTACWAVFLAAIDLKLPIRGAGSAGELRVSHELRIGKPLIAAYDAERYQKWVGCYLDNDCIKRISTDTIDRYVKERTIIKYPIPFEDGRRKEYAYNWVDQVLQDANKHDRSKYQFLDPKDYWTENETTKRQNTMEFINYVLCRSCQHAASSMRDSPGERRIKYKSKTIVFYLRMRL